MYRITYDGLTVFDPYGNANEVVSDASMSVEVNASAYLDFTMAITHPLYDTIKERSGVVSLTWDGTVLFEGVVESIDMDIQGTKSISCVSAMDYLNDTHVRPYSTVAGEADLTAPSSVDGYFQWLIDQHNLRVLDSDKMFDVGINQGASLQQNNFIYRASESNPTTASEITDQILDSLGGYLTMRYEDGRKVLDLYADLHTMNAQIVDFGVNITDFSKTTDTTDQYTAILARGGSPEFQGGDFESRDWEHWVTHPNTPLVGDQTHGGDVASYFVSGTGEYVNDSFFYSRPGRRYKATVYVKNERGSNVTIRGSYQYEQAGKWTTANVNSSLAVENKDDQWVEFSFDFQPSLSDYTKIRPRWYFDNVGNDNNRRVYLDDFSFSQVEGDTDVSEDPIGLTMVPDGVTKYDSDMTKTDDVIYSLSAVERYGYKETVFEDSTITDVDDLVQAAIKELNKSKDPQITLDIKAVDLALFMEGYTHLNVGDAVRVRSAIHDTDEFLMVNSITLDLQDPGQSEYVIGKAYDSLTGRQSGYLRSLNSGINSSLDQVASLDQASKDQAIQLGKVEEVANDASDKADQAQDTANSASDKADQAQSAADNAQQTADAAKDKADQNEIAISEEEQKRIELEDRTNDLIDNVTSFQQQTNESFEAVNSAVDTIADQANAVSDRAEELAGQLDAANAVIDRHEEELGSLTTTITNTVDKLDNLEIGARNLIRNTKVETGIKIGLNSKYDKEETFLVGDDGFGYADHTVTLLDEAASGWLFLFRDLILDQIKPATDYVLSFEVQSNVEESFLFQIQQTDGRNRLTVWNGSERTAIPVSTSWTKIVARARTEDSFEGLTVNTQVVYLSCAHLTSATLPWNIKIRKLKLEEGTVPTDWSPAPEDLESIADEALTVSTEVKQTAEEIRATAKSAYSNANEALTQSSEAVQTADSIRTTLEQDYSTTDELNQTFASKSEVEQTAQAITSTVEQTYATKSSLEALQNIADSAIQTWTGNGIPTLSKPPASDWTTTELKQQHSGDLYYDNETGYAFRFGSSDGVNFSWARIADSDITKALADAAKAQETAEGAIDEVEQLKIDIPDTYATKTEVTQTADSIRSEVSANYTTKETFNTISKDDNLWPNQYFESGKPMIPSGNTPVEDVTPPGGGSAIYLGSRDHSNLGTAFPVTPGHIYRITVDAFLVRGTIALKAGIWWTKYTSGTAFDMYRSPISSSDLSDGWKHYVYEITALSGKQAGAVFFQLEQSSSGGSTGYYISNLVVKDVTVEKTLESGVSDASLLAQSALDKSTTVEQDLNGFRTTVSETYVVKNDVGVPNLMVNGDFEDDYSHWFKPSDEDSWSLSEGSHGSELSFTMTAANNSGDHRIYNNSYNHTTGAVYEISLYAKADKASTWKIGPNNSSKAPTLELDDTLRLYTKQYQSDAGTVVSVWLTEDFPSTITIAQVKLRRISVLAASEDALGDLSEIVNENNANTASLIQSSIEQTKSSIISQVSASYYTKTEAEELMAQMSTQFAQTENSFEMQFNSLRAIVDQVNESADANYSNIQKYIRFVDGHIVIGVEGNPFSLDIGNDRISFMQNNSEIAYISNHEFYITSGIITQNLRIGYFEFRPRSNGNLSLSLAVKNLLDGANWVDNYRLTTEGAMMVDNIHCFAEKFAVAYGTYKLTWEGSLASGEYVYVSGFSSSGSYVGRPFTLIQGPKSQTSVTFTIPSTMAQIAVNLPKTKKATAMLQAVI